MPFKIVGTIERGKSQLCVVPSQWETGGILKWPKKGAEKLVIDQNSIPRPEWANINCTVKRQHFSSYEAANAELQSMLECTDTEHEDEQRTNFRRPVQNRDVVNLNDIAEQLVLPVTNTSEAELNQESLSQDTYFLLQNNPENQTPEQMSNIQQLLL